FYGSIISYEKQGAKVLTQTWCMNQSGIYKLDFLREFNILFNEIPGASYQDTGFWFQVFTLAHSIYFVKEAHYCYRRDNPNSSSVSKAKVYCICEEYDFMRDFLKRYPKIELETAKISTYLRFKGYVWNLNRIAQEFKLEFLQRIQQDFKELEAKGELDWSYFDALQSAKLKRILKDPKEYYQDKCLPRPLRLLFKIQKPLKLFLNLIKNQRNIDGRKFTN
ncbi:glycosyltransferase family 2 protein, partial [Helicobacter sp. Faydin-H70]|nr:glycosyltransferase family 2 protein [Helicobacter turcicus]